MVDKRSLGNDPLDWIGAGTKSLPETGSETKQLPRADSQRPSSRLRGEPRITVEPTELELPPIPGADASTLERELLLMQVQELKTGPDRRKRRRSNRILLTLILIFAACGAGAILFRETRSNWSKQVVNLQSTIDQLEKDREQTGTLFRDVLASKDRMIQEKEEVIGDKQKIISDLQLLHRKSLTDLKQAWKDTRELQAKYSNFFRVIFTSSGRPEEKKEDGKEEGKEEAVAKDDHTGADSSAAP